MLNDLILFQKFYDFTLWIYPTINKFPKTQRFVLGQQISNTVLEILKKIIQANAEKYKVPYQKQISIELDKLRILMRLSKDLKFLSVKQYEFSADKINEIGRLLGGWIKSA
ncbi:MAG: diversity-generating retroelement protein Avd [Patescibacteria group bacterium]